MRFSLFVLLVLTTASVCAEVFKWVDEKGVVHYGDKPTADSQVVDIHQKKKSVKPSVSSGFDEEELSREEKRQRITDMLEEDRLAKDEKREKEKKERERKKRKCNSMKDYQKRAGNAGRMYKLDRDGNRVYISDEKKSKSEQKLKKQIQKNCS